VISFDCNNCGKKLRVKDEFAGQTGQCPSCGQQMEIPSHDTESAPQKPVYDVVPEPDTAPDEERVHAAGPVRLVPPRSRKNEYGENEWAPTGEVCNHSGGPISGKDDFFVPPPRELGEVASATTTLRKDAEPMSPGARLAGGIAAGAVGLVIGVVIAVNLKNAFWQLFWPVLLGGLGLAIALFATGFAHTCTYVAREGLARFRCSGSRDQVKEEMFRFADAAELRTSQTRHYTNGVYQNTAYSFTWTDAGGRVRFVIAGSHKSEQGNPPAKDLFHFATAAERAWTLYKLDEIQAQLRTDGMIYSGLGGRNWVKLGQERITLFFNGEEIDCHADEIDQVRIEQGWVQVRRKDAKEGWFSSRGVFKFPYGSLANAQLFLILMDKLVGVRING